MPVSRIESDRYGRLPWMDTSTMSQFAIHGSCPRTRVSDLDIVLGNIRFDVYRDGGTLIPRRSEDGAVSWGFGGQTTHPGFDRAAASLGNGSLEERLVEASKNVGARPVNGPAVVWGCPACGRTAAESLRAPLARCAVCHSLSRGNFSQGAANEIYESSGAAYFQAPVTGSQYCGHGYEDYDEWGHVILGSEHFGARIDIVSPAAGSRWLDVGCATGALANTAAMRDCTVLGIDLSTYAVARARELVGSADFEVGRITDMSGKWDVISYMDSLEHIVDPLIELQEARHHLVAGGVLIVEVPNQQSIEAYICGEEFLFEEHVSFFTPGGLASLVDAAGFVDIEMRAWPDSYYRADRLLTDAEVSMLEHALAFERLILTARAG